MKTVAGIWLGLLMIVLSAPMNGQGLLNVAFRPSANVTLKELGGNNLQMGGGFETTFSYQVFRGFNIYGGWGWNTFQFEEDPASLDHIEETGYRFGVQRIQPVSKESKLNFLVSAGVS